MAMVSRFSKQTEQDSDRRNDCHSDGVRGDTGTEAKDSRVNNGTNQTHQMLRDAQVPKKTTKCSANSRHAYLFAHDKRLGLVPSDSLSHTSYYYFPSKYQLPSHSFHNYYKPQHRHHNTNRNSFRYYQHHRTPSQLLRSTANQSIMAPFDDATIATSNIPKDKINDQHEKQPLTINTTRRDSDMKQDAKDYSNPYPPAYSFPHHGKYYRQHGPYHNYDGNSAQGRFEFHDYDHRGEDEDEYPFSISPISMGTPQRSNKSSRIETRHRADPRNSVDLSKKGYHANWKYDRNGSMYYNWPSYHPHDSYGTDYRIHELDPEYDQIPHVITTESTMSDRSTATHDQPSHDERESLSHASASYRNRWYSDFEYPHDSYHSREPYDRHYFSPSPPPPPPSPHPDYYMPSAESFTMRPASPPPSWSRGSYDDHNSTRSNPMSYYKPYPTTDRRHYYPADYSQQEDRKRPRTPTSNQSVKLIPEVTPAKPTGREALSLSDIDKNSSKNVVTPDDKHGDVSGASTFKPSSPFVALRDNDIVCGRGAPTNFHIGNSQFRELVLDYHRAYFVAKRSDKPRIAMKVLDVLASQGARFVRRIKGRSSASSQWEEVAHKVAYEKVCQALRDAGGPPRQMMSKKAASSKARANRSLSVPPKGSLEAIHRGNSENNNLALASNGSRNEANEGEENDAAHH